MSAPRKEVRLSSSPLLCRSPARGRDDYRAALNVPENWLNVPACLSELVACFALARDISAREYWRVQNSCDCRVAMSRGST